jgi:hypothetical protein
MVGWYLTALILPILSSVIGVGCVDAGDTIDKWGC